MGCIIEWTIVTELASVTSDDNMDDHMDGSEEIDMEASSELGFSTSLFRFACTVCSRMFTSYVNMCRHRRLAHGRYGGICSGSQFTSHKRKYSLFFKSTPAKNMLVGTRCLQQKPVFSDNVHHNLCYYLEGKRLHLRSLQPTVYLSRHFFSLKSLTFLFLDSLPLPTILKDSFAFHRILRCGSI